jgi:Reverse transcriptase (RNA-dependent DNA polymerase)
MTTKDGYTKYMKDTHGRTIDPRTHCLKLKIAIYGLVPAPRRQWWKEFQEILLTLGCSASRASPWLFIWKEIKNISYLIVYVDDGGRFGSKQDIKMVIETLSKHFVVNNLGEMKKFFGCEILTNQNPLCLYINLN